MSTELHSAFEKMMVEKYPLFPLETRTIKNYEIPNFVSETVYLSAGTQHMWNGYRAASQESKT